MAKLCGAWSLSHCVDADSGNDEHGQIEHPEHGHAHQSPERHHVVGHLQRVPIAAAHRHAGVETVGGVPHRSYEVAVFEYLGSQSEADSEEVHAEGPPEEGDGGEAAVREGEGV